MKLTKTVKYHYQLTEETLEKDIDNFIKDAKAGRYNWDRHNNGEGLKIIKQYFRVLKDKFDNNELQECKLCYEKLILFCIDASGANNCDNLFDYEDLLAKITDEFDDYIKNYFICLVKTSDIEELSDKVARYASRLDIYGFESDKDVLLNNLDKETLHNLENRLLIKTEGMTKKDQDKQDILSFILYLAQKQKDKEKYIKLCSRFNGILRDNEIRDIIEEYEDE